MAYTKTIWNEGAAPGISGAKLNNIEQGIYEAHERISNLALTPGGTTGDAELADIRVGADGKSYDNAGDAVRTQVATLGAKIDEVSGQLSSEIVELNNNSIALYDILTINGYIENGGAFRATNDTKRSDFIKVSQGDIVNFNLRGVGGFDILAFYSDKNVNTYVSGINGNTIKGTFVVPSNGYIAVCCLNSYKDGYLYFSQQNDYLTQFVKANNGVKDLSGTYVLNFGDSCARGIGAWDNDLNDYYSYSRLFAKKHNASLIDLSVSGCPLCNMTDDSVCDQVDQAIVNHASKNVSVILVEGGINDLKWGRSNGTLTDSYDGSGYDDTTIIGALETIFYKLRNAFPKAIIIFVAYHHMPVGTLSQQNTQHDGFESACQKWGVAMADVFKEGQLNSNIESMAIAYFNKNADETFGRDIAHPNREAYEKFYLPLIDRIVN